MRGSTTRTATKEWTVTANSSRATLEIPVVGAEDVCGCARFLGLAVAAGATSIEAATGELFAMVDSSVAVLESAAAQCPVGSDAERLLREAAAARSRAA
jgi:hypothetical protein